MNKYNLKIGFRILITGVLVVLSALLGACGSSTSAPIEQPLTEAILSPDWTSLNAGLIQKNCTSCHREKNAAKFDRATLIFDNEDNVRVEAAKMLEEMSGGDMPPPASKLSGPSAKNIAVFKEWVDSGFKN